MADKREKSGAEKTEKSGHSGQSKGGQHSGGNFKTIRNTPQKRAKRGGEYLHGGSHEQHVKQLAKPQE